MKCPQCGKKNESEFCSGCGHKLEAPAIPVRAEPEKGAESWRWVIVWTVVALLLVAGLCYYAFRPENTLIEPRGGGSHGPDPSTIRLPPPR